MGVPAAIAGKLMHRVALEMVRLNFCSTLCSHNWPEPLASGGRQITHSKTSRTPRSQSQISPVNYLHIKSVCKYIWSLNCFCMLWLTRNRNSTFRDTFSYCLSISLAEQAAKRTRTIGTLAMKHLCLEPFCKLSHNCVQIDYDSSESFGNVLWDFFFYKQSRECRPSWKGVCLVPSEWGLQAAVSDKPLYTGLQQNAQRTASYWNVLCIKQYRLSVPLAF